MKSTIITLSIGFISLTFTAKAQTLPDSLKRCEDVRKWIRNIYYDKRQILSYAKARKYMYAYIDNYNDTLTCVYGGLKVYHKFGDESTDVDPLNCEHTVPIPSELESRQGYYDIHHLYPVNKRWNSTRKNYPFKDIPDNLTKKWMVKDTFINQIPMEFKDNYSEYYNYTFEPREDHKGNVARSIFYYATMNDWFDLKGLEGVSDLITLKRWHEQDPPDAKERERNYRIEKYQGNRNPYIDHPEWVYKAWFCSPTTDITEAEKHNINIYPNPVLDNLNIDFGAKNGVYKIRIYNVLGKVLYTQNDINENTYLSLPHLMRGIYILTVYTEGGYLPIKRCTFIKS